WTLLFEPVRSLRLSRRVGYVCVPPLRLSHHFAARAVLPYARGGLRQRIIRQIHGHFRPEEAEFRGSYPVAIVKRTRGSTCDQSVSSVTASACRWRCRA